jgi:hypothetical protein
MTNYCLSNQIKIIFSFFFFCILSVLCDKYSGNGLGVYDGGVYDGDWVDNVWHGKGKIHFKEIGTYEGDFQHGLITGKGVFTLNDGNILYEGDWLDGNWHGQGTRKYANGQYTGEFVSNKKNGRGMYRDNFILGAGFYDGNWVNDQIEGLGVRNYADKSMYSGEWKNGEWHGKGELKTVDGTISNGNWINGKIFGFGSTTYPDGGFYQGDFKDSLYHGKGILRASLAGGNYYEGDFVKGIFHGQGSFHYENGIVKQGTFFNGKYQNNDLLEEL